jgi:LmbE family N-acetylglucosaminyl deacetylase
MSTELLDILFAAPHPDDLEITCGGTIALLAEQGHRVGMVHMTTGEPTPRGSLEIRAAESRAAADVLGVQVCETLGLTNRELMDGPAARYALATVLRRYKPRILVGMAGRTPAASPEHYQGQLIIEASRFYSQLTKWDDRFGETAPHRMDHLVYRPTPLSAEKHEYHSTFVIDITSTIQKKLDAVKCYASQFDGDRYGRVAHYIRCLAGTEGGPCGYVYGELFAMPRPLGVKDMMRLLTPFEVPPPFGSSEKITPY